MYSERHKSFTNLYVVPKYSKAQTGQLKASFVIGEYRKYNIGINFVKFMKKEPSVSRASSGGKTRLIVMNSMRIILLIALGIGFFRQRNLILTVAIIGLIITFLPTIISRLFKFEVPAGYEIVSLLFVYGLLYMGEVKGFYEQFWIVGFLLKLLASIIFGLVGLAALHTLYREEKVHGSPLIIAFFAFCFAVSIGALWEMFEFLLDIVFEFSLQKSGFDTMKDMASYIVGAIIVSGAGYFYLKQGRVMLISAIVEKLIRRNASRLGIPSNQDNIKEHVRRLIGEGENSKVEFKSTLRTNLHTNQIDRGVEHAALKTVAGYLNSDGGTLLIGVDDAKQVIGIEKDNFPSNDKLGLHMTNLIKESIGPEYLPFIVFDMIDIDGKHVLKIDCKKSDKEVFVKIGKEEHFYVRNGPSTATLTGSSLVEYITNRFR